MKDCYKFWLAVLLFVVLIFFPVKAGFSMNLPSTGPGINFPGLDLSMNLPKMDISFNMFK